MDIKKRFTDETIQALWPTDAGCSECGLGPAVVFHWFNQRKGKSVDKGYDWFMCAKCDVEDPYGEGQGGDEFLTIKIYKMPALPTKIKLKVEVQK